MPITSISYSRIIYLLLLGFLVTLMVAGCKNPQKSNSVVKIGFMNCNNEQETLQRFKPITKYLSEKIGVEFVTVPVDTHEFEKRFKSGEFTITHTNSLLYIILKEHYKSNLIAAEKRGNFGSKTGGAIIARKGKGINTLQDLKGKRFAFGPMFAPTGYLAEYDLLLKNNINPEHDFFYTIPEGSFKHEKLVYGVLFGGYDAAAAPLLDLEVMTKEGKISADDFVILAQTPIIPYCNFSADPKADPELVAKIRKALLELKPSDTVEINGERVQVLKSAWVDGYEELADKEYDPIRDMARRTNMPPYQKY